MVRVVWQEGALEDLKSINDYYCLNASQKVAKELVTDILKTAKSIKRFPNSCAIEPLFDGITPTFRYALVRRTWKVIYFVEDNCCHVAVIWDTRNNPEILRSRIMLV